jgi:hypothetical protein
MEWMEKWPILPSEVQRGTKLRKERRAKDIYTLAHIDFK